MFPDVSGCTLTLTRLARVHCLTTILTCPLQAKAVIHVWQQSSITTQDCSDMHTCTRHAIRQYMYIKYCLLNLTLTYVKPSIVRYQRRHVRYLHWQQFTGTSVGRDINWHAPWRRTTRRCTLDDWAVCFNVPWCDVKTFVWHRYDADVVYLLWRHVNASIHQQHNKAPVYNCHHDVMPKIAQYIQALTGRLNLNSYET